MTRAHLASAALVALSLLGSTGCGGGRYYHARYHYGYAASVHVVRVAPMAPLAYEEAPPPPAPPPPPRPQPRIVRMTSSQLPPGTTVIIVNPTPAQARGQGILPPQPAAPPPQAPQDEPQEEPQQPQQAAPQQAPQQGAPAWFDGE